MFKGFYLDEDVIHIFFDLSECILSIDCTYRKSQLWFCLIDEIINYNKVCSLNIDSSVINFFITNINFSNIISELIQYIHKVIMFIY